jgi:hypothetical protein
MELRRSIGRRGGVEGEGGLFLQIEMVYKAQSRNLDRRREVEEVFE